ncbi:MAG: hypothetical protein LBL18_01530, partial [Bacteroidales bacterium]|nr:hypothetical protein [Bacteroidales bacterium]
MKSYKVLLFIIIVITMLAFICAFFPKEGISIGSLHLHFPSLEKVLTRNSEEADTDIDSLLGISQTVDSCLQSSRDTIAHYVKELSVNPAKFYFPHNNLSYFDPLFETMSNAEQSGTTVRVLHYGDSQIELDRLSCNLRSFFQEIFGGSGPGMLPLIQNISTSSVSQYTAGGATPYAAYGETNRRRDGLYGPMAKCFAMNSEVAFNVTASKSEQTDSNLKHFGSVKLLMNVHGNSFTATLKSKAAGYEQSQTASNGLQLLEWQFDSLVSNLRLNLQGSADIYGIMVDGNGGVAVDNIPMRGCSGTIFTRINDSLLLKSYQML